MFKTLHTANIGRLKKEFCVTFYEKGYMAIKLGFLNGHVNKVKRIYYKIMFNIKYKANSLKSLVLSKIFMIFPSFQEFHDFSKFPETGIQGLFPMWEPCRL